MSVERNSSQGMVVVQSSVRPIVRRMYLDTEFFRNRYIFKHNMQNACSWCVFAIPTWKHYCYILPIGISPIFIYRINGICGEYSFRETRFVWRIILYEQNRSTQ